MYALFLTLFCICKVVMNPPDTSARQILDACYNWMRNTRELDELVFIPTGRWVKLHPDELGTCRIQRGRTDLTGRMRLLHQVSRQPTVDFVGHHGRGTLRSGSRWIRFPNLQAQPWQFVPERLHREAPLHCWLAEPTCNPTTSSATTRRSHSRRAQPCRSRRPPKIVYR